MAKKFNPWKTYANGGRALSQWTEVPPVICGACGASINTTMELVRDGKCEACAKKQASEKKN